VIKRIERTFAMEPTSEGTLGGDRSTVLRDDHRAEPRDRVASVTWRAALFTSVASTLRS